ncbi:MAG: tRNA uridine-5-carboxymethylaminomethyl(34) synthesis GTPase MnmE, partial [Acidobacteriota bacterium]|nr:tRNA uridine-5-carboxymethylaminomethyl(34) synthesis GTPase MnmE [Acidobacteriota bacterium]
MHDLSTTLVAVATPVGRGGLGCLRIGGTDALSIAEKLFRSASTSGGWVAGKTRLGQFLDRAGDAIDHGYAVHFAQGKSYSGDSTVEFWTHGSPVVLDELLRGAVACGAVAAGPGEFTYRALRNGRIDLPRAEAIHDLIEARTVYQARVAHAQAEGALSLMLSPLRDELEEWIARSEAAVEFVDESET